ncbi:MAG TPA: carboxypeptidase-like regulatory domain-containing protein [Bacteroidales bacterium]
MKHLFSLLFILQLFTTAHSQTATQASDTSYSGKALSGVVLDSDTKAILPYTNIYVLRTGKGTISNELGHFTLNLDGLGKTDTLRFQYVGYKTRNIPLSELEISSVVYLQAEIINLSELLVFSSEPDLIEIVKNVLKHKDANYKPTTSKEQVFIRQRDIADIEKLNFNYKKSSIPELDRKTIALAEEKIPRNFTSYTDFLGNLYFTKNKDDSITLKVEPIRTVSLKEKDITELDQIAKIFEKAFASTREGEYWKVKTGIFSQELDQEDLKPEPENDSVNNNSQQLKYYGNSIKYRLEYSSLDDKDDWEFLHSTGKYNYRLLGGSRVNGEDVYIIDFTPKKGGLYQGRMFIATGTYALIRADYEFAPDKVGTDFHLLGVGYTENDLKGSIYFEKKNDNYELKYFSKKASSSASFDRSIALIKKRKRTFFDETLNEIKIGVELSVNMESSIEYLVLEEKGISEKQFTDFKQPEKMDVIYVGQFNDNLWKGYSIIEPTEQMKEYKKQVIKLED